jgi:diaminopimelate epimerase
MKVDYTVLDPTGNITILVTSPVEISLQPPVASKLMELVPEAEQVGFLSEAEGCDIALRMAGGEFCGNASMCAATYYVNEEGLNTCQVTLHVSGAEGPVAAEIEKLPDGKWRGTVNMPRPQKLDMVDLPGVGKLPVVSFDGISHVIYEVPDSKPSGGYSDVDSASDMSVSHFEAANKLDELPISRAEAETLAYDWCRYLGVDALGIMFLNTEASSMTPLVYVPAAGTLFWENSCASGTTACGAYAAARTGGPVSLSLGQPGGSLEIRVSEDGASRLSGTVRITHSGSADITV